MKFKILLLTLILGATTHSWAMEVDAADIEERPMKDKEKKERYGSYWSKKSPEQKFNKQIDKLTSSYGKTSEELRNARSGGSYEVAVGEDAESEKAAKAEQFKEAKRALNSVKDIDRKSSFWDRNMKSRDGRIKNRIDKVYDEIDSDTKNKLIQEVEDLFDSRGSKKVSKKTKNMFKKMKKIFKSRLEKNKIADIYKRKVRFDSKPDSIDKIYEYPQDKIARINWIKGQGTREAMSKAEKKWNNVEIFKDFENGNFDRDTAAEANAKRKILKSLDEKLRKRFNKDRTNMDEDALNQEFETIITKKEEDLKKIAEEDEKRVNAIAE
jgi:hypothetical protein